jgi:hypothetical protein
MAIVLKSENFPQHPWTLVVDSFYCCVAKMYWENKLCCCSGVYIIYILYMWVNMVGIYVMHKVVFGQIDFILPMRKLMKMRLIQNANHEIQKHSLTGFCTSHLTHKNESCNDRTKICKYNLVIHELWKYVGTTQLAI